MPELIEGKYEVLGKLAEGGMGAVFKVRHVHLDEVRVLKVMKAPIQSEKDARERFREEARMATSLRHPGIALVYDFAVDGSGAFFIVMEYVEGVNLKQLLDSSGPLAPALLIEVGRQALAALGALHAAGIVHRDVSPENLMATPNEKGFPVVKLIDLGVAKRVQAPASMTTTGVFLGKLLYASPEQLGKLGPGETLDGRSDLYALGCVLYLLATGRQAFTGSSPEALIVAHLMNGPIPFSAGEEFRIPEGIRSVIWRALATNREARFASAEEMSHALGLARSQLESGAVLLPPGVEPRAAVPVAPNEMPRLPALDRDTERLDPSSAPGARRPWSRAQRIRRISLVAGLAVAVLAIGLALGSRRRGPAAVAPEPTPVPRMGVATASGTPALQAGVVLLTAAPWAELIVLRAADGTPVYVTGSTPMRLALPPGSYRARLAYAGKEFDIAFESRAGEITPAHGDAPGFDAGTVAREQAR